MRKKTLIMSLCSVLAVTSVALGSVAYLTSSASVTNRFTVGNISLTVNETQVNPQGQPVDGNGNVVDPSNPDSGEPARTNGNQYHLIPGHTYTKDPTATIDKNSESCYVRLLVTISKAASLDALCQAMHAADPQKYPYGLPQDHVSGYDAETWVFVAPAVADTQADTVTYEFRYFDKANNTEVVTPDGTDDVVLDPLFDSITVPGEITTEQLESIRDFEINVVGQAIQNEGFQSADEAWAAFPQMNDTTENEGDDNENNTENDTGNNEEQQGNAETE